jgi:hypothetical protein
LRWKSNGYDIRIYATDHPPLHAHVFKEGKLIARFDLESRKFMDGSVERHRGRVRQALVKVGLI